MNQHPFITRSSNGQPAAEVRLGHPDVYWNRQSHHARFSASTASSSPKAMGKQAKMIKSKAEGQGGIGTSGLCLAG